MKLQRSRFRLILLLLVCTFLAVLFFGSRQAGLLPELPSLSETTETTVPEYGGRNDVRRICRREPEQMAAAVYWDTVQSRHITADVSSSHINGG